MSTIARPFVLLLLTACAANPAVAPAEHSHAHVSTVTITDRELLPSPDVRIPTFATVAFRNRSARVVVVHVDVAACPECETVLGFAPTADGVRSTAIAPGSLATLCFHEPGAFAFSVRGDAPATAEPQLRGNIVVGVQP